MINNKIRSKDLDVELLTEEIQELIELEDILCVRDINNYNNINKL